MSIRGVRWRRSRRAKLDAGYFFSPYTVQAEEDGLRRVYSPSVPFFEEGVVVTWNTSSDNAESNPEVMDSFIEAVAEANTWANENPDEVKQGAIDKLGLDLEPDQMPLPYFPEEMNADDIQRMADRMVDIGLIEDASMATDSVYSGQ